MTTRNFWTARAEADDFDSEDDEDDGVCRVVIETGSSVIKSGFADSADSVPRGVVPNVVVDRTHAISAGWRPVRNPPKNTYYCDEAVSKKRSVGFGPLLSPMKRSVISDWPKMEQIWQHIFHSELRVNADECCVFLIDSILSPKMSREKMAEIMFESFRIPALSIAPQSVMALFGVGKVTGTVLHAGHSTTLTVPVFEGIPQTHAINRSFFAGADISANLVQLLKSKLLDSDCETIVGLWHDSNLEHIKQTVLDVGKSEHKEDESAKVSYELPDGTLLEFGAERFECAEPLFTESGGIHKMTVDSLRKCESAMRRELAVVELSGGSTLFPSLTTRLTQELSRCKALAIASISATIDRRYIPWVGACVLCSRDAFEDMWLTSDVYHEMGASVIHRKCIFG